MMSKISTKAQVGQFQDKISELPVDLSKKTSYREYIRRNSNFHYSVPLEHAKVMGVFFPRRKPTIKF